jgi:hypothetical protein
MVISSNFKSFINHSTPFSLVILSAFALLAASTMAGTDIETIDPLFKNFLLFILVTMCFKGDIIRPVKIITKPLT